MLREHRVTCGLRGILTVLWLLPSFVGYSMELCVVHQAAAAAALGAPAGSVRSGVALGSAGAGASGKGPKSGLSKRDQSASDEAHDDVPLPP